MAKEIKWTKTAIKNFDKTIAWLNENWTPAVVSDFIIRSQELLHLLAEFPELGEIQDAKREIRGILLTRHNKLFYRVDGNKLIVLKIFGTRQNPKKLRFR
jgi:plasmid stabilization system protein ParE